MVKYILPYKSYDDNQWLVEFDIPGYFGEPIPIRGVAGSACTIIFEGGGYDTGMWNYPLVDVSAQFEVYNQGQIDALEILSFNDKDCIVTVKRENEIKFKGFLVVDDLQVRYGQAPYVMSLNAKTGVGGLQDLEFKIFDASLGTRCPLNYFRRILMQQLGLDLPIRWSTSLRALNETISGEPFQSLRWAQYGDGILVNTATERIKYQSCGYIIEGLTKALQCRMFQSDGAWWVLGINEQLKDVLHYYECTNKIGLPIVTEHSRNSSKIIGNLEYPWIKEDTVISNYNGKSSIVVKYDQNQSDNILPNGGLDLWSTGNLMWWGVDNHSDLMMLQFDSITNRGGYSVELMNSSNYLRKFGLIRPLPIDAHTLYRFLSGFDQTINRSSILL
ncbi:hypothetical protein ACP6L2_03855 [Sphingobacterium lactis]|uniref:hypothetical protein n=1 Tax=Sphingobacterium lactis TaxID=797291 RepID=UPI003F8059E9